MDGVGNAKGFRIVRLVKGKGLMLLVAKQSVQRPGVQKATGRNGKFPTSLVWHSFIPYFLWARLCAWHRTSKRRQT